MDNDYKNNTIDSAKDDAPAPENKMSRFDKLVAKVEALVNYCISGVWNDPRNSIKVRIVKTLNLSVSSFMNRGLQIRSMALTYSMVLALVPAIALLVAIGRGFGLQNSLMEELYYFFPSQHKAISTALKFVDSYLTEATQGVFVGVGIVVLLWTVVSLLSSIEDAFNSIWDVKAERPFYQKVTDYIAICLIIPILMICSSGVSIFMSTTIQDNLVLPFLTPVINFCLEFVPFVLAWLAFTLSFFLIPNIKVDFKYSAISGAFCAFAFQILQLLFVNGQIYVSKYNAIYGSFAFLPLMLIWMQLSFMILLAGCVLTYSLQNVFTFNLLGDVSQVSYRGWHSLSLITMSVIAKRFIKGEEPLSCQEIASRYNLPVRIVNRIAEKFLQAKLIYIVKLKDGTSGLTPALSVADLSLGHFYEILDSAGAKEIVPDFDVLYKDMLDIIRPLAIDSYRDYDRLLVKDIPLPTPEKIKEILVAQQSANLHPSKK